MKMIVKLGVVGVVLALAGEANAAGFAIAEQSPVGLGSAFAGGAAAAEDASTVWYNPAGMTRLGTDVVAATHFIFPSADFNRTTATAANGATLTGPDKNASLNAFVPNFYAVMAPTGDLRVGLGINAPFGLKTDYNPTWVGRYFGVTSDLKTININPSVAYRVTDWFSVGAGLDVQYLQARLSKVSDLAGSVLGAAFSQAGDLLSDVSGDSWGYGFNAGVLLEPRPGTRLGIHYRSPIHHSIRGNADFTALNATAAAIVAGAGGAFQDTTVSSEIKLPDIISASLYHEIADNLALMADVTWYRWSRAQKIAFIFDNPTPVSTEQLNYQNTYRVAGGVRWDFDDRFTFRAGGAYDQTPTNDRDRSVRLPDESRVWLTFGATMRVSEVLELSASYAHLFFPDKPSINQTDGAGNNLVGSYDASVDIVSLQATLRF